MVLRKCLLLMVSAWLINTVVCFHGSNPFGEHSAFDLNKRHTRFAPQSLILWLIDQDKASADNNDGPEKIKFRYRYLNAQKTDLHVFSKFLDTSESDGDRLVEKRDDVTCIVSLTERLRVLHIPLFRLTPF